MSRKMGLLETQLGINAANVAIPLILEFVEQAVGRRNASCDDLPQRVEKTAFIVARAVEPGAVREAERRDVENAAGELAHRLSVRRHSVERELGHFMANL